MLYPFWALWAQIGAYMAQKRYNIRGKMKFNEFLYLFHSSPYAIPFWRHRRQFGAHRAPKGYSIRSILI